jgi:hypothetical protein
VAGWTSDELQRIAKADELRIASRRRDGTLRDPVTVWAIRDGDDIYVRSVNGRNGKWFRGTQQRHEGHIRAGGVEKDVTFVEPEKDVAERIDRAYREKYGRYAKSIVDTTLTPAARAATLRLTPKT